MKTSVTLLACSLLAMATASAQNAYDAEKLLGNDLNGTARFVGMGGAMGALGGDMSVMTSNPAGIGIYRRNDASVSFGFNVTSTESSFNGTHMDESRTKASFDQAGFVYSFKVGNNTALRYVNFGFNYHRSKNFSRLFSMGGALNGLSQSWQLAEMMNDYIDYNDLSITNSSTFQDKVLGSANAYTKYWNSLPVLSVMGAQTGVVDWPEGASQMMGWDGNSNHYYSKETGGIDQYDFNISFNINDRVYLGVTFGFYDMDYKRYSTYIENVDDDYGEDNGSYALQNYYHMDGSGFDVKMGVIVRPFESSPFRLGFAVHTPTWYDLRERYDAYMESDIDYYNASYDQMLSNYICPNVLTYDFDLRTPWKFNVSAGTTFGGVLAVGAEYEYQNYSTSKLEDVDGYELGYQYTIEDYLKGVHTVRVGLEARVLPAFSIRAGYNYSSAAFEKDAYSPLALYSTHTEFDNKECRHTLTAGLGFRGNYFYADLAYKYDMYKSKFYAFDDVDLPATKVDNSRHQLLLTLGARF